jgi:hypothetical protein
MNPGARSAVFVAVALFVCLSGARAQAPANDSCFSSIAVGLPSSTFGNNVGATVTPALAGGCSNGADVWYTFVAPFTGTASASTCGFIPGATNYDTVLNVWDFAGSSFACTTGSSPLACNDDFCGLRSSVTFPVVLGHGYYIAVGGYAGAMGNFELAVSGTPAIPPNDTCATAIPIGLGWLQSAENSGATTGPDPTANCGPMTKDVWYSFVAPSCGTYTVSTCALANFDTVIGIWSGPCGSLAAVTCNDDNCSSAGQGMNSTVSFAGTTGTTYFISVGGFNGAFGSFGLNLTGSAGAPMTLSFIHNGPGTIGYTISNGPSNGTAFTAITLNHGAYPSGWFYGIDIPIPDLMGEWFGGYPFVALLPGACGSATAGPYGGLPSGLILYGVSLGIPSGGGAVPTANSSPVSGTVP